MGFFDSDVSRDSVYNTPEDFKSGLADLLSEAKKIYEAKKQLGFQDYEGERIADFTPEEEAAMAGIAGLVGEGKKYFDPATDLAKGVADKFTAETAQEYMSPYQQAVTDVAKRKAREDFDTTLQDIALKSSLGGGRRGTARAIVEAEGVQDLGQRLSDIQTLGSQSAFQDARRAFEAQKGRERQAGSALASLGKQVPEQALKELTALAGVGAAQRGMDQSGLDLAYQNFLQKQQYPYDVLGQYQSTLYGYPYQSFQTAKGTAQPSGFQNLMGVLNTGRALFPNFGFGYTGGKIGNLAFRSEGGLSGLTATYQDGTKDKTVGNTVTETTKPKSNKEMITEYLKEMLSGSKDVTKQYGEALKKQQEIANIKKQRLENRGFMDRLGEFAKGVVEGYDPNKPQTMAGSLAAGAKAVKDEDELLIERANIEEQLAKGQISLAEAKVKLANLGLKTVTALDKLTVDPFKFEGPQINEIETLISGFVPKPLKSKEYKMYISDVYTQALKEARLKAYQLNITDEVKFNQLVKDIAKQLVVQGVGLQNKNNKASSETTTEKPSARVSEILEKTEAIAKEVKGM